MLLASIVTFFLDKIYHLPPLAVYLVVGILVFGEAALFIGFVLPGETAVIVAGIVASHHKVNIYFLCALVVAAAIIGDSVGYLIGERHGDKLLGLPVIRHRRGAIESALQGLHKRGPVYVFAGRFTAFLRAVMPGLAGMSKMHYRRFLVANALGGLVWGLTFTLMGFFTGRAVERYAGWGGLCLLVAFVLLFGHHLYKRRRERAREAAYEYAARAGKQEI